MGLILISDVEGGSIVSADNPLDFDDEIWPVLAFNLKCLNNGWNTSSAEVLNSVLVIYLSWLLRLFSISVIVVL